MRSLVYDPVTSLSARKLDTCSSIRLPTSAADGERSPEPPHPAFAIAKAKVSATQTSGTLTLPYPWRIDMPLPSARNPHGTSTDEALDKSCAILRPSGATTKTLSSGIPTLPARVAQQRH